MEFIVFLNEKKGIFEDEVFWIWWTNFSPLIFIVIFMEIKFCRFDFKEILENF